MEGPKKPEVIIIGSGMSGSHIASILARENISIDKVCVLNTEDSDFEEKLKNAQPNIEKIKEDFEFKITRMNPYPEEPLDGRSKRRLRRKKGRK